MSARAKKFFIDTLAQADIQVGGTRPWDITVHNERLYDRVISGGSLAVGESYMDGWWDSPALDQFFTKVFEAELEKKIPWTWSLLWTTLSAQLFNLQSHSRAFQVGEEHYDRGNNLYRAMLDKRLVYTCGYWKDATDLGHAQEAKLDLVCRKIGLKKDDTVLDIGCGWGSFLKFASERFHTKGVGVTVSEEQKALADELCKSLPIEIKLEDYRDIKGTFNHVISLGMFEHVGHKNYRTYMNTVHSVLKDDGLFLLHTIGGNISEVATDPWVAKYIFPNGLVPSAEQIAKASEGLFVMEDWHNFGQYYDKTCMAWFDNFDSAWPELSKTYSKKFYRMWKFYLLVSAANFRARRLQLWQIVFSKHGVKGGYTPVR